MARPQGSDSEQTHGRILSEALRLLEEVGPSDLSLRKVAIGAGLSTSTVRYYFGSKEELIEAVLDEPYRELDDVQAEVVRLLTAGDAAPDDPFAEIARLALGWNRRHRTVVRLNLASIFGRGGFHPRRLQTALLPSLDVAGTAMAALWGIPPAQARLTCQSTIFLLARYAVLNEEELRLIVGLGEGASDDDVDAELVQHLAGLMRALTAPPQADH